MTFVSQNVQSVENFTEGNARKSTVDFAFFGYADVINIRKNLRFHLTASRLPKLASSGRVQS